MDSSKQFKMFRRGETIIKAGDPISEIYIVQSGLATLSLQRQDKAIEVGQVGVGQILGEEALWGQREWSVSAVANNDVRALPLEPAQAVAMLGSGASLTRVFLKALVEKERSYWNTLVEIKSVEDPTPCPAARVTRLFAVLHQAASYTGSKKAGATVVVWPAFKKYCQRTFLESPVRLEQAVNILVRLGAAKLEMIPCETDPEAPDELGFVHFTDLDRVRDFYRFYREMYYSSGGMILSSDQAQTTEPNLGILREIEEWNRKGKVEAPLPPPKKEEAA